MTFRLHRAARAAALADALADVLSATPDDPFTPEVVSVHSQGVERWLGHRLSMRLGTSPGRADGISANLRFPFPGALVGDALAAATGVDRRQDPWRPERLVWPLLDVVDTHLGEPWMKVLRVHLGWAPGGQSDPSKADRRFGTVRHLADLFDEYATHRPHMLLAWLSGRDDDGSGTGAELPEDLAWQAELWRNLRSVVTEPSPAERLAQGCDALRSDPGMVDLPGRFSLYGFTRLPSSYVEVLAALAAHREVHLFALHPSPAAWSKVAALDSKDRSAAARATEEISHPLLRTWGRDCREMQLVLAGHGMAGGDALAVVEPAPSTLLERLQADIRGDVDPSSTNWSALLPTDGSIQIHSCHGRSRQAEIVRDAITHLFEADPTLEPRDVVVLCPDIDGMAPLFHAAFGTIDPDAPDALSTGTPALRYRLADRSLRQTNPLLGAVSDLLDLVDARLTATQVLTFAGLGPVRHRFALDDDDLERVAAWINGTGIRWGIDAAHRSPYGLAEVTAGTWRTGIERLLLGVTMSEDHLRLVGSTLPLDDVDAGDIALAGRFTELIDRLATSLRHLQPVQTLASWTAALRRSADLLLHTHPTEAWQRAQLDGLLNELDDHAGTTGGVALRITEVRDLLRDRLRGQPTRGAFRSGDITLCTLVPMRSVPHRVVCLVGLDDGAFPRGSRSDGDDILLRARCLGDHDRPAEDRQLLLDALLAAGENLVITYAGRDERTNELLPPAVPVQELLATIEATSPGAAAQVVTEHPLHATDRRSFEPANDGRPWSYDRVDLAAARASLGDPRPVPRFAEAVLPPPPPDDLIALEEVVAFVQHPTRAFLRTRLGLSLRSWDDRPADSLGIAVDALAQWQFGDRILTALLAGTPVDAACEAERARGLLPPGALGDRVLAAVRPKAEAIYAAAVAAADGPRSSLEIDVSLPDGRRVVGTVTDVFRSGEQRAAAVREATFSTVRARQRLGAWVRFLAATASHPDTTLTSALIGWGGRSAIVVGTGPFELARARDRLVEIVDLRDRGMRAPLPMACATSHAYAAAYRDGDEDPVVVASTRWQSEWKRRNEDKDEEHVFVYDGELPYDALIAVPPAEDEQGVGWPKDSSRFGVLARRLWEPILSGTTTRTAQ